MPFDPQQMFFDHTKQAALDTFSALNEDLRKKAVLTYNTDVISHGKEAAPIWLTISASVDTDPVTLVAIATHFLPFFDVELQHPVTSSFCFLVRGREFTTELFHFACGPRGELIDGNPAPK